MPAKIHLKNYTRWIALAAVAVFMLGIGIAVVGAALGGFNFAKIFGVNQGELETKTLSASSGASKIIVDVDTDEIVIEKSDSQEFELISQKDKYDIQEGTQELKITSIESKRNYFKVLGKVDSYSKLTLKIPADYKGAIDIGTDFGSIDVSGGFSFSDAVMKTDSGKINISDISSEKDMSVSSDFGEIVIRNATAAGDMFIKTNSGRIEADSISVGGRCNTSSDFGQIVMNDGKGKNLDIHCSSGSIDLTDSTFQKEISLNSNFGEIKMRSIFSEDITIEADSGKISGTISGNQEDFMIESNVDFGKNSLGNKTNGKYRLSVYSSFGDVDVSFMK